MIVNAKVLVYFGGRCTAMFYCVFRDRWKNLRGRFCLSKRLEKHWLHTCQMYSWLYFQNYCQKRLFNSYQLWIQARPKERAALTLLIKSRWLQNNCKHVQFFP